MSVEVTVPSEFQSGIMAQLAKRGGTVTNTASTYGTFVVSADVPLSNMFGYASELRGAT